MSYDDEDINLNPDVIINATSESCGIELHEMADGDGWQIVIGTTVYGKYLDYKTNYGVSRSGWAQAKRAITEMSLLQWMALAL